MINNRVGYRRLWGSEGARSLIVGAFLVRASIGMASVALVVAVTEGSGNLAQGGLISGVYLAAAAAAAPVQGRLMDRRGIRPVILWLTAVGAIATGALVIGLYTNAAAPVVATLAICSGGLRPNVASAIRVIWWTRFEDPTLRVRAAAFEAVAGPTAFTVGPLIASGMMAAASGRAALLMSALFATAGGVLFVAGRAASVAVDRVTSERKLGGFRAALLVASYGCFFSAVGAVELGVTATAVNQGTPALAGVLVAVSTIGAIVAGLAYGARARADQVPEHLTTALAGSTIACVALALFSGLPELLVPLALFGLARGLVPAAVSFLSPLFADAGRRAEAVGVAGVMPFLGGGIGRTVASWMPAAEPAYSFLFAAAASAVAGLLALLLAKRGNHSEPLG